MIRPYLELAAHHWRPLLFGVLLMALSNFGQAAVISASGPGFRDAFGLSNGGLGAVYATATLLAALTLPPLGPVIDRTTVRRYAWGVSAALAGACLVVASSPDVFVFAAGVYALRLAGQGLMAHTAMTATARALPSDVGKALGLVFLGFSAGQAALPVLLVAVADALGWRWAWACAAVVVLCGAAVAIGCLPPDAGPGDAAGGQTAAPAAEGAVSAWRDPRLLLALPSLMAVSSVLSGFVFHQAQLAAEKGWALEWLAGSLAAFAAAGAATSLAAGPAIDRFGAVPLLPLFLAPFGLGLALLWLFSSPWVAPVYLALAGVSAGVDATLAVKLFAELHGPARLARTRSTFEAARVVATGAAPILMGVLIDQGVPLSTQALGCVVYIVCASAVAVVVKAARRTSTHP